MSEQEGPSLLQTHKRQGCDESFPLPARKMGNNLNVANPPVKGGQPSSTYYEQPTTGGNGIS